MMDKEFIEKLNDLEAKFQEAEKAHMKAEGDFRLAKYQFSEARETVNTELTEKHKEDAYCIETRQKVELFFCKQVLTRAIVNYKEEIELKNIFVFDHFVISVTQEHYKYKSPKARGIHRHEYKTDSLKCFPANKKQKLKTAKRKLQDYIDDISKL